MTTRRFKFSAGMDTTIVLDVDTSLMTEEMAQEVNNFWACAKEVLASADGDVIQAAARRAAPQLIMELINGWTPEHAAHLLGEQEGWPKEHGIKIVAADIPEFDAEHLVLEET